MVTPFDEKGNIAPESVEKLVEHCLEKGVRGFYVGGAQEKSLSAFCPKKDVIMLELVIKTVRAQSGCDRQYRCVFY